jgi:radical SAM superfamily enzyme YgiQ (UPF0313 family)
MRVLLIHPDTDPLSVIPQGLINVEPLGLEYLAAVLPNHDVKILDMKVVKDWRPVVENFAPNLVGVTGTVVHTPRMLAILQYVKQLNPDTITVVGGPQATLVPNELAAPQVDFLIRGQRPQSFRLLVDHLERGKPVTEIDGLSIRTGRDWFRTSEPARLTNLDHLPLPRRDLTLPYRSHYCHLIWKPVALIVTSVGCPHACSFCPCPTLTGHQVLRRSPRLVVEELERISEPYIYVGDDNLFFDYEHASEIADLIELCGIKKQYYVLSRVDDINKHPDIIERWARLGLKKVFLGLESPDDVEIKALNKRGSVSENSKAIEILHANHVDPLGAFIVRPEYTRADFDRILAYMDKMRIYFFEFTVLTPFPGTEFYEEVQHDLLSQDRRFFDLAHSLFPTRLPAAQFYREYSRLHRRAASPLRALRIRPTISPFRRLAYFRQSPQLVRLFFSARTAYSRMGQMIGAHRKSSVTDSLR